MNKAIFITLLFGTLNPFVHGQSDSSLTKELLAIQKNFEKHNQVIDSLNSKVSSLQWHLNRQKEHINLLNSESDSLKASINIQKNLIDSNSLNVTSIAEDLGIKIEVTGENAETQISQLGGDVEKNRLYWIIATFLTLLLGGLMYLFLGKRIKTSQTDVETQIRNTKTALEEESVKLDGQLVEVLSKQLEIIKADHEKSKGINENDHSLVLKVADRLTAMETNHYRMDPNTKGLKQLVRAVKSIKENYLASGYEIVEMVGQEYKEGLNVTANFIPSEEIETGKRVITRIIKPQVNFKEKMIQAAQIEVSVGE
jgi:hypothetical protein